MKTMQKEQKKRKLISVAGIVIISLLLAASGLYACLLKGVSASKCGAILNSAKWSWNSEAAILVDAKTFLSEEMCNDTNFIGIVWSGDDGPNSISRSEKAYYEKKHKSDYQGPFCLGCRRIFLVKQCGIIKYVDVTTLR